MLSALYETDGPKVSLRIMTMEKAVLSVRKRKPLSAGKFIMIFLSDDEI